ncbi:hypothetical protein MMU07_02635 [Aquiflexum sp. LQ15W]|uniref:hypothetical protein n=1 Tax=Cognataquiflexum nitidum TaxID=2922272 RepID=UPI001F134B46|nr:hypothetical protein [Cognataquiflexum nitidum]MCH6198461.1 hypothetical protein [Cognataquiflexum nitidum]
MTELITIIIGQAKVPAVEGGKFEALQLFPVLTQQLDEVNGLPELGVQACEVYVT